MDLHKRIPKELQTNLRWRRFVLRKCRGNRKLQKAMREYCAQDIIFYIDTFCFQTNPNKGEDGTAGPFICWPWQERAITSEEEGREGILWCIRNRKNMVCEKSREMGVTWVFLLVDDHQCRFKMYVDTIMMSKSAKAVDDASRQSLFGKLRFMQKHLPKWLHNEDAFIDNKMCQVYGGSHSTNTGEASTGEAGVGGRATWMFVDEFSAIDEDWEVLSRTQGTTQCRMFNGTHRGEGTAFHSITKSEHFKKLRIHWTMHPDKNRGMYRWDKEERRMEWLKYNDQTDELEIVDSPHEYVFPADYDFDKSGKPVGGPHPGVRSPAYDSAYRGMGENDSEMAKEWDINPSGSIAQFYNPLVTRQLIDTYARPPLWECDIEYDEKTGVPVKMVRKPGGLIKLWCNLDAMGKPPIAFYGAGADISAGNGCTPSCLSLWDARTGEKVLEYMNAYIFPYEFGVLSVAICRLFRDHDSTGAKLAWENHGPGTVFGTTVWDTLKYLRVYVATSEMKYGKKESDKPGWNPNSVARLRLHSDYRQGLCDRNCINRSKHALDETLRFKDDGKGSVEHTQYKNTRDPAGGRENHGDVVIADALGYKMIKDYGRTLELQESPKAEPGTLAYLWQQEESRKSRRDELYPNWNLRKR